jgi:chaperonin cofactor prefoldin
LMLLAQIEQRLLLDIEAEQTRAAAVEEMGQRTGALEQRLRTLQDENQSLRRQLEQAQNIIDEITNIEQSIRERESAD